MFTTVFAPGSFLFDMTEQPPPFHHPMGSCILKQTRILTNDRAPTDAENGNGVHHVCSFVMSSTSFTVNINGSVCEKPTGELASSDMAVIRFTLPMLCDSAACFAQPGFQ